MAAREAKTAKRRIPFARWGAWCGFGAAVALVVAMSIGAYEEALPSFLSIDGIDKIVHFAMAATLAFFLDRALGRRAAWSGRFAPPLSSLALLAPIGVEEYLQRFSAVRSSSLWDFTADASGIVFATWLSRRFSERSTASSDENAPSVCSSARPKWASSFFVPLPERRSGKRH